MSLDQGFESFMTADAPLAERTWFGVGGSAEWLATPSSIEELVALVTRCRDEGVPVRLLGNGSNVLVKDEGVSGVVISLESEAFQKINVDGNQVRVGGGVSLPSLINETVRNGLAGLDPLVGIPGTVGAALHHNAGGRGGDIGQWTVEATVLTRAGETITRNSEELFFAYRQSSLDELVILEVVFKLESADPAELTKRMQKQWIVNKATQPMSHQRTGQIFRNPRGMSSGMLIDQAGLKGTKVGGAEVSAQHANFFTAADGTTSNDLIQLIDQVKARVHERMGVELELAIEIW